MLLSLGCRSTISHIVTRLIELGKAKMMHQRSDERLFRQYSFQKQDAFLFYKNELEASTRNIANSSRTNLNEAELNSRD